MSRLSALAVRKRSVTLLLAFALFVAGISAWGSLKQELLPDIDFPVITIIAPFPGAGASDVANQVAKPIEQAVSGVPRLVTVQSTSANSLALVVAQFEYGTNVKDATAAVSEGVAKAGLPQTVEPNVSALNINASPVLIASLAAPTQEGLERTAEIARTEVVPELLAIDGVSRADVTGGLESRLMVTLEPAKLAANGMSAQQVVGVLQANNLTVPSGQLVEDGTKIPVSTIGSLTTPDEVAGLVVGFAPVAPAAPAAPGASPAPAAPPTPVTIGQLGTVAIDQAATTGYARTNGSPSLTLSVTKTGDANTVVVSDAVTAKLDEIAARHPDELKVTIVSNLADFIKESTEGLLREGGLGALFAVITIFLFLFSLRATIVAAVSIPLSILTALVIMQVTGISLNIMTLGGLAVAVGRVVDDAIVVLENIYRHRALGEDRMTAVLNGPREVAGAITASTLTTVAVFLPLGFVGGLVSQFFLPFALTVTFALLASLICALTVVPVLAYFLVDRVRMQVDVDGEPMNSIWIRIYTPTILFALRSRATKFGVLGVAAILFVLAMSLVSSLPTQFINAGSEKILQVSIAPPSGTPSDVVLATAIEAETIIDADPDVELIQTSIPGEGDTSFQTIIAAQSGRPREQRDLDRPPRPLGRSRRQDRGISTTAMAPIKADGYDVQVSEAAGFSSNGLNIIVSAEDPAVVASTTETVVTALADQPGIANLKSDLVKATSEVQVTVDPNKAIALGLTAVQVANEVRTALVPTTATQVTIEDGRPVDLIVQLDPATVDSVDALRQLPVGTVAKVPLAQVATVEQADVQGSITRIDQSPASSITAKITSEDTGRRVRLRRRRDRLAQGLGADPAGRDRRARRRHPAAERGVRRPVRLDGRRDPARLRDDGPRVRLARDAVHHPVQPAAGPDRGDPRALPDRAADRRQRAHRVPDAHRDRGDERDRPPRPRRAAAPPGLLDPRRPRRGRADPRPADPHDGDRDDPRA